MLQNRKKEEAFKSHAACDYRQGAVIQQILPPGWKRFPFWNMICCVCFKSCAACDYRQGVGVVGIIQRVLTQTGLSIKCWPKNRLWLRKDSCLTELAISVWNRGILLDPTFQYLRGAPNITKLPLARKWIRDWHFGWGRGKDRDYC